MTRWFRTIAVAIIAPLVLSSCLFLPGKFSSALTIHADRSFTFTYTGEVAAIDLQALMGKAMQAGAASASVSKDKKAKDAPPAIPDLTLTPEEKAKQDDSFRKLAADLAKEAGYRSVEYRGNGIFYVDYQVSGVLNHSFVYPYNLDNQMIWPWIAVELRGKDLVRVKAQGFARPDAGGMGMGGGMGSSMGAFPFAGIGDAVNRLDGTFTLTTDAELVSQNNEEGATAAGANRTVTWKVSPATKDAPMASMRVKPLP